MGKFSKSSKIDFFYVKCSKIHPLQFSTILFGIYNFGVTKQGYKTEFTHYDVTNRVTNSKIFRVNNSM